MTTGKSPAERTIEALTWASVVIWLGFALVAHILNYVWLVVLVLSIILLSSAIYQRSRNWHTSLSIWIFGIWMAVFSVIELVSEMIEATSGEGLGIDLWVYLGVALVSMGVAVVFRMVTPSMVTDQRAASRRPTDYNQGYDRDRRNVAPRRVEQDLSSAWMAPAQGSAQRGDRRSTASRPPDYDRSQGQGQSRDYARGRSDDPYRDPSDQYAEFDAYPTDSRRARRIDDAPDAGWDTGWGTQPYDQPTQERPYEGERISRQRGRGRSQPQQSQRAQRSRRTARPASRQPAPGTDLESRVEDIINRSRSRRTESAEGSSEDLPY